ncbi:MAG: hypothetical protein AB2708_04455 [Candidatus Thiodiazotropha taylori]
MTEAELQKLSDIVRPLVHGDVLASIRNELKVVMKEAFKEVIDENMNQLSSKITRLTSENIALKGRVIKLEQALDDATIKSLK